MKHCFKLQLLILFPLFLAGCNLFSSPNGETEIISKYSKDIDNYHTLIVNIKISNISNKNIYSSTISLQADSTKRSYYKTQTNNITIKPGNSIYITLEFVFEDEKETNFSTNEEKEKWKEDSVKIIDIFWN